MNVENIKKVRDVIANVAPERFDMNVWAARTNNMDPLFSDELVHTCGTCGCIGGWANAILHTPRGARHAREALGLTFIQAEELFYGFRVGRAYSPTHAVAVLNHLIATGEADWNVAEQVSA